MKSTLFIALFLLFIPALDACTDDEETSDTDQNTVETTPTPEPTPEITAEGVIEDASERVGEVESLQFEMESAGRVTIEGIGDINLENVTGSVDRPDRAHAEIGIEVGGMSVPLEIVSIGGDVYMTDPFSGSWQEAPQELRFNPAVIFDEDEGVPALLENAEDAEIQDTEQVDGNTTHHITAVADRETVRTTTSGMIDASDDVDFEIWVDEETYDIRRIRLVDPTAESDDVWMMRIFSHNEPVEIEDPGLE